MRRDFTARMNALLDELFATGRLSAPEKEALSEACREMEAEHGLLLHEMATIRTVLTAMIGDLLKSAGWTEK